MAEIVTTAAHPFATQSPLFKHAYCKGLIRSILANTALPQATRMEQCEAALNQIRNSLGIQLQENDESYLQTVAMTDIEQIHSTLRNELTSDVSRVAFLYEIAFYQQVRFRTGAEFQAIWQSFAEKLKFRNNAIPALWSACQILANCHFPQLDIPLLSWLCGVCGINWGDVMEIIFGENALNENITVLLPGGVPLELAWIPAGVFQMGSPSNEAERDDDELSHQVRISKGFWMGIYPVTQRQYNAVMGNNPSNYDGFDSHPVESITWFNAKDFCEHAMEVAQNIPAGMQFDLPTEAQWEYACRAGSTTPFHFGDNLNGEQANCDGTRPYGTQEEGTNVGCTCNVGSYAPNAWGLYDMHGNVWEWCNDWYGPYQDGFATDPEGAANGTQRSERGGSWRNAAGRCRAAIRRKGEPNSTYDNLGFRVILTSGR